MKGADLLEAMSFVDERLVDEAENAEIRNTSGKIWLRWAAMAACVCIVAMGVFAFRRMDRDAVVERAGETISQVKENIVDLAGDDAILRAEQTLPAGDAAPAIPQAPAEATVSEQPSVVLRIDRWTEDGFVGTVERTVDTEIFPVGKQLQVYLAEDTWIQMNEQDALRDKSLLPEGALVMVQFSDYDEESGTLWVNVLSDAD